MSAPITRLVNALALAGLVGVAFATVLSLRSEASMVPCYWDPKVLMCLSGTCEEHNGTCHYVGECICFVGEPAE